MTLMPARAMAIIAGSVAALALAACGPKAERPAEQVEGQAARTPPAEVAAALDPCAGRSNAFDQALCQNQSLAALNTEISEALVAEAASVSEDGADVLVQNQRRWRAAQRIACGLLDDETAPTAEQQSCLEAQFRARVADAQNAVQDVGGYTFQRVEVVDAMPINAQVAAAAGVADTGIQAVQRNIRYPRIDGDTPEIRRFNQLVAQQPENRLEDGVNETVDYRIAYAGPEIISVRFDMSQDSLGGAHPSTSAKAVTVMMEEGRALTAADVFRAGSGWERFLTQRAVREITSEFRDYGFVPPERDVRETATKPHLWLVTEEGLTIIFPEYSFGGPYALGSIDVSIPWTELRPYLNPQAPAPIRASA